MSRAEMVRAMRVSMHIGEVMLKASVSVAEVQQALRRLTAAFGLDRCEVSVTLDTVTLCAWCEGEPVTVVQVVEVEEPQLDRLVAVDELSRRVARGEVSLADADAELAAITGAPPAATHRASFVALVVSAIAWVVFAGGGWGGAAAAVAMTVIITGVTRWWLAIRIESVFGTAFAAGVVVVVPHTLSEVGLPIGTATTITGGLYPLLPGGALVAAVADGLQGAPITSVAKTLQVVRQAVALALGALTALTAVVTLGFDGPASASATPEVVTVIAAGVAIAALATARGLDTVTAALTAVLAVVASMVPTFTAVQTWGRMLGVFVAGAVIGVGAQVLARLRRITPTVFTANAVYVLVPGYTIYLAMMSFAREDPAQGGQLAVAAVSQAVAIAGGIALGTVVGAGRLRARS